MLLKFAGNTKPGETGLEFRELRKSVRRVWKKQDTILKALSANFSGKANCKWENDKMELETAGKDLVAMTTSKLAMSQSYHSTAKRSPQ